MEILFVTATERLKLNAVSNGTMLLGTKLLEAGFDVDILRFCQISNYKVNYEEFIIEITNEILERSPRCVSFYTLWPTYHISLRIAKEIKSRNKDIYIILGGPQSSATAEKTMQQYDFVDFICTGEGENTVVPFFYTLLRNQDLNFSAIPGLYFRSDNNICHNSSNIPLCDLNKLPYWDDRLIKSWNPSEEHDIQSSRYYMPIDAGRGCPYSCTFCSTSNFWRRTYRLKSAERIIDDITYYNKKYGIKSFWFSHDAFTSNMKLVSSVCDHIIERKLDITWHCTTRIDCLTEELIIKMIKAGLRHIDIGIETGSPRMQKVINKRLNLDYAKKLIQFLIQNNLYVEIFFMYGFPEETEEDLNQTLGYLFDCLDMGANQASMSLCRFAPATQLTIDHIDHLSLNDNSIVLSRGIFGYNEEISEIRNNRDIFSTFYDLNTPLRNKYHHLFYFEWLYEKRKITLSFVRSLYKGDNLSFYRDFYVNNTSFFSDNATATNAIKNKQTDLIINTIRDVSEPVSTFLHSILDFDIDFEYIKKSEEDVSIVKTYSFNYIDFLEKLPIEQFTAYKSELEIVKTNENVTVRMINIIPF